MPNADSEEGMGKGNNWEVNCGGEEAKPMHMETTPEHAIAQTLQDQSTGRNEQGLGKGIKQEVSSAGDGDQSMQLDISQGDAHAQTQEEGGANWGRIVQREEVPPQEADGRDRALHGRLSQDRAELTISPLCVERVRGVATPPGPEALHSRERHPTKDTC